MKRKMMAFGLVVIFAGSVFTSCQKNEELTAPEIGSEKVATQSSVPETRASRNVTYYSTPSVGGTVPNSTIDIKGLGSATYHGGVLSAKVLSQNGDKFTIRISKQDGGTFQGYGHAFVMVGTVSGTVAGYQSYTPGIRYVDIEVTATFNQGYVHFYPATRDRSTGYRYYAEPVLVYTSPMYNMKSSYTSGELLGTANGVSVKANGYKNISYGDYQCTEFCIRYYNTVYGKNYIHFLDANRWFNDIHNFPDLVRYQNNGTTSPRPGDILCMSGGANGKGHVAIIMEVTNSYIKVAQQNTGIVGNNWQHAIGGQFSRDGNDIIPPSNYDIDGWMRISPN